jgi:chaperone BCS1
MILWLSKQPAWRRSKELSITTRRFGVGYGAALVDGEEDDNNDGDSRNKVKFLPSHDRSASLWYRGHYIRLSRSRIPDGFRMKDILTIRWASDPSMRFSHYQ